MPSGSHWVCIKQGSFRAVEHWVHGLTKYCRGKKGGVPLYVYGLANSDCNIGVQSLHVINFYEGFPFCLRFGYL